MSKETVVIILGASQWPKSSDIWPDAAIFRNSAEELHRYVLDSNGLNLPSHQVLDLFDDARSQSDINEHIETFLRAADRPKNILIYYTGHGAFTESDHRYCLAMRTSRVGDLVSSGYRIASLARVLNKVSSDARRFLILDSCFAGAAVPEFMPQGDAESAAKLLEEQTFDAMAETGTALLCAASSSEQAFAPTKDQYTMFTGALLQALRKGSVAGSELLSFDDLRPLVWSCIHSRFRDLGVTPNLYDADQRHGSISKVGFFPNAARRTTPTPCPPSSTVVAPPPLKLAVFLDVDLTLTEDYIQSYYAKDLGCYPQYQKLEDDLRDQKITSEIFGKELIKLFASKGFTLEKAKQVYYDVGLYPFAKKVLRMTTVDRYLVSTGPNYFIEELSKQYGIPRDRVLCSEYRFNGKTGIIQHCYAVNSAGKQKFVMEKSIGYDITIGIGDSDISDGGFVNVCTIPMLTRTHQGFIQCENFNSETVFILIEKLSKALRL
jgi:2-hydroxy-3-keto-5-methylthiopentenyl-1-phosphate phosphatase